MSRPSAREIALNALARWRTSREFADAIIQNALAQTALAASDRGFAQELFYGVLRNLILLDFWLGQLREGEVEDAARDLLRLGLYQLLILGTPEHAAVFETVEIAPRKMRPLINGVLRAAIRQRDHLQNAAESTPLSIRESHPQFLIERWTKNFGAEAASAICRWNNQPAPIYARINTLRITREDFLEQNPNLHPVESHPFFVRCDSFPIDAVTRGDCYIQDPSTAVALDLLRPATCETILDACAAPGGKTSLIAALTDNRANIFAADRDVGRLDLLRLNLKRLGANSVQIVQQNWLRDPPRQELEPFDKILVDAPCTNTGVMRRRIDVRWRLASDDFARMHGQQIGIVRAVLPLLKPGGALVYSTCSIEREENEGVVEQLLRENSRLKLETTRTVLPWHDDFDGAFAARFTLTN